MLVPPLDASPEDVRALLAPLRGDFSVALFGDNPFAIGTIVRTAHNFLAREIVLVGAGTWYEKASMGMEKYETIVRVPDPASFFAHVAGRPVWALEKDSATCEIADLPGFPKDVVLALGGEKDGLPREVLDRADRVVGIQLYGVNHSLPVVVAAGIAMHEWARRHHRRPR